MGAAVCVLCILVVYWRPLQRCVWWAQFVGHTFSTYTTDLGSIRYQDTYAAEKERHGKIVQFYVELDYRQIYQSIITSDEKNTQNFPQSGILARPFAGQCSSQPSQLINRLPGKQRTDSDGKRDFLFRTPFPPHACAA